MINVIVGKFAKNVKVNFAVNWNKSKARPTGLIIKLYSY